MTAARKAVRVSFRAAQAKKVPDEKAVDRRRRPFDEPDEAGNRLLRAVRVKRSRRRCQFGQASSGDANETQVAAVLR